MNELSTDQNLFNAYGHYYNLLYKDKDYAGETEYIHNLLNQHDIINGDILEFGSGTGKHGNLLALQGHKIHGIERSAEMVSQASSCEGFTCEQGDICTIKINRRFDAVLSLFHVLSYQISNENVSAVFARASEHLKTGGIFIFDFWYSPAVYSQQPVVRVKRMLDDAVEITRIAEPIIYPNENRVDVCYTIYAREIASNKVSTLNEIHPMRHFSLPEIDMFAQSNGFALMRTEEFLTGKSAGVDTWGVCVILKRL